VVTLGRGYALRKLSGAEWLAGDNELPAHRAPAEFQEKDALRQPQLFDPRASGTFGIQIVVVAAVTAMRLDFADAWRPLEQIIWWVSQLAASVAKMHHGALIRSGKQARSHITREEDAERAADGRVPWPNPIQHDAI
jgi:hypothetical protein